MATSIGVKLGIDGEAEYRKQLNNIVQTTKTLDKQLAEVASAFDDEADSMKKNAAETDLLQQKAQKLAEEVEMMQQMVDAAAEKFGENSTECQKWEQALATAQTQLNNTNTAIDEHIQAADEMNSALGQLTSEISSQESELSSLRDQYVNAVLEFGDTSDEAQELAAQISNVSAELQENKQRLDEANASADALTGELQETAEAEGDIGDDAMTMAGAFGGSISSMASAIASGGVAGAVLAIATACVQVAEDIVEMQSAFETGMSTIQIGTGKAEEELMAFTEAAKQANAAIVGVDIQTTSEAVAALSTRLNLTATDSEYAAEQVGKFYKVLGVESTSAVNGAVDAMYQWGMVTGDSATDAETLVAILDMLTVAQQNAPVSVEALTDTLSTQAVAYQSLGLNMTDAVSMIDSYVNHGGNLNDITTAAYNIFKNLNGEVDDLPGAFTEIVDKVSNSSDAFSTMSEQVTGTGKSIEDILGAKKAGAIINTFSTAGATVDEFSDSLADTSGNLNKLYNGSITTSEKIDYALNKSLENATNKTIKARKGMSDLDLIAKTYNLTVTKGSSLIAKLTNVGEGWTKEVDSMTGAISSLTDETTKTTYTFDQFGELVGVTIDGVEQDVTRMQRTVAKEYEATRGELSQNVNIGLSSDLDDLTGKSDRATKHLLSNHEEIKTELSKPIPLKISAPAIEYKTYGNGNNINMIPTEASRMEFAQAYDHAMILSAPTIFGAMGNQLLVGGDRPGNEIVVGERHLTDLLTKIVNNGSGGRPIELNVYGAEGQNVEQLADIVIDKLQNEIYNSEATYA